MLADQPERNPIALIDASIQHQTHLFVGVRDHQVAATVCISVDCPECSSDMRRREVLAPGIVAADPLQFRSPKSHKFPVKRIFSPGPK